MIPTLHAERFGPRQSWNRLPSWLLNALFLVAAVAAAPFLLQAETGQRAALAICALGVLGIGLIYSRTQGICAILVFLALLGGVRRWLIPAIGWTPNDPLLLACPLLAGAIFVSLVVRRTISTQRLLPRLILALMALMTLEIANPTQGGLSVGLAGALFYLAPPLWFFLGAMIGEETLLKQLFRTVIVVASAAAVYGLYQMWFGFPQSEQMWIASSGYSALHVGAQIRPFSFFASSAEYVTFLGVGIALLWSAWLRGNRAALLPIPLLGLALFLASVRNTLVLTVVACALLWAVQGRTLWSWAPRGLFALFLAVACSVWALDRVQSAQFDSSMQSLVSHQTSGLLNPLDSDQSTALLHSSMAVNGMAEGLAHPLGDGLGATTQAASKFGVSGGSTEVDLSNMCESLGIFGGLLYFAVIVAAFALAIGSWRRDQSWVTLSTLGILLVEIGQWLTGGQYSTAMLVWFALGALDRMLRTQA